jgi:hypothetical protein
MKRTSEKFQEVHCVKTRPKNGAEVDNPDQTLRSTNFTNRKVVKLRSDRKQKILFHKHLFSVQK